MQTAWSVGPHINRIGPQLEGSSVQLDGIVKQLVIEIDVRQLD
jgi:hypothetical protein